ncbi:MAG: glycosyltransferase family 4 protein [Mycobacteriaceae bacterium]|nr:glycosyltransferase family 4 protein [Mycobacteriaceae bacterium]
MSSRRPLRVLVVGPAPVGLTSRGGTQTVVALMAAHPDERMCITMVVTYLDRVVWQRLAIGVYGMLRAAWLVLRGRADIMHVHLTHGGSVVRKAVPLLAARWVGVPTIVHGHSYDFGGWFDRLPTWGQLAVRRMLIADHWLVLGDRYVDEYASRLRIPDGRISVLHNAVRVVDTAVTQLGIERVHAVALGRLGIRKGSYDVIAAVSTLDETVRSRLHVTLVGDGEVDAVRAAVTAARLDETISVLEWLTPAARDELLASAHIFVLPSRDEGLPMALLEAMAYGLAPITTTVGSIGEVVTDQINGIVVQPGVPSQIADALTTLVNDEGLRSRLGTAARDRVGEFGLDCWYRRLALLWTELARKSPVLR